MTPDDTIYVRESLLKATRDRRRFYEVTGSTYLEQFNKWRRLYDVRPRSIDWDTFLQRRLAFIRRVAL